MNLLKIAVGMNFLASALFAINAGVSVYTGKENYIKYLQNKHITLVFLIMRRAN